MTEKKQQGPFKIGDIVRARIPGTRGRHVCIILKDVTTNGHQECLPVCNFTGTKVASGGEYAIDVSKYKLPDNWFGTKKPNSWIRCNDIDCIKGTNIKNADKLGNIRDEYSALWKDVCQATANCAISSKLQHICDCEYEEIQTKIDEGEISNFNCGCNT